MMPDVTLGIRNVKKDLEYSPANSATPPLVEREGGSQRSRPWCKVGAALQGRRKVQEEEREGLTVLWNKARQKLACMQRAENIRRGRKRKKKERSSFFTNTFRYA